MHRILPVMLTAPVMIVCLAVGLIGCQNLTAIDAYKDDAVKAVAITMAAYDSGVQPQIERYKAWPKKGTAECAAMKTDLLCRDEAVFAKLKAANNVASAAIHKARQVVDGAITDESGTALQDAAKAIADVQPPLPIVVVPATTPAPTP